MIKKINFFIFFLSRTMLISIHSESCIYISGNPFTINNSSSYWLYFWVKNDNEITYKVYQ